MKSEQNTDRYDYDFKSMVFCGGCGWRYRKKKNYKKYVWRCGNSTSNGIESCNSMQIPDNILYKLADGIIGEIMKIIILWHSNNKYRKTIWQCNRKFKKEHKCATPTLDERTIKDKFIKALNLSLKNKDEIIKNCKIIIGVVSDTTEIVSQDDYIKEYTKLTVKYEKKIKQKEKLIAEKEDKLRRINEIKLYVQKMIETQNFITERDDTLWALFLDVATVNTDSTMEYQFKDGSKISV